MECLPQVHSSFNVPTILGPSFYIPCSPPLGLEATSWVPKVHAPSIFLWEAHFHPLCNFSKHFLKGSEIHFSKYSSIMQQLPQMHAPWKCDQYPNFHS